MAIKIRKISREERNARIVTDIRNRAGVGAPRNSKMQIKKLTAEVAIQMALLHGGDWRVRIDHDEGLVIVARRGRRQTL